MDETRARGFVFFVVVVVMTLVYQKTEAHSKIA